MAMRTRFRMLHTKAPIPPKTTAILKTRLIVGHESNVWLVAINRR